MYVCETTEYLYVRLERKKVEICTFVKQWEKKRKERVNLNAHL